MAGAGSGLRAAAVLSWLSFVWRWSASELLGSGLHGHMKSPLMWATLAFAVGEHDKQVGFPFHTNKPVLSGILSKGLKSTPLVALLMSVDKRGQRM